MFGQTTKPDVPIEGDIEISQSLYATAMAASLISRAVFVRQSG
jgi:hypothetical protein